MTETIAVQVARGAEWLDAEYPGWEHKVNTETLAMFNGSCCTLGQVTSFGGRIAEMEDSGKSYKQAIDWLVAHGFGVYGRDEWIATIEARRAEQRVPVTEVNVEAEVAV